MTLAWNPETVHPWGLALAIVGGTLASEDLTCVAVGLLVREGRIGWGLGLTAAFLGIFLGDLGLWLLGRGLAAGVVRWGWLRQRLPADRLETLGTWFDRRGGWAVLAARFLPGLRLPFFVAAGALGGGAGPFIAWSAVAALLWTPLLVGGAALAGDAAGAPAGENLGTGWLAFALLLAAGWLGLRCLRSLSTVAGRGRALARLARLWRWEFWPSWLFYLPLLPYLAWLALWHRSATVWTAANPGIPQGGVVGESKFAILEQLPPEWVVPSGLIAPGPLADRLAAFDRLAAQPGWAFPLILKPDTAQRGAGVKLVRDRADVEKYLHGQPAAVVAQTYHPGPHEAGIFYYRLPGEATGHLFSITDKVFPQAVGDGVSTLEELIWRHPRYRMQAAVFLPRHAADRDRVLAAGEVLPLALAGNHCQGTLFRDGAHLITPELERTVDAIARRFQGFHVGRFDVRYRDVAAFRAGRDLAVVELNGVTAESTNLYDPSWSLGRAYRTLARQWALLFRIGAANRARGHAPAGAWELLRLVRAYYRRFRADPLAD